jgi:hypothetical protein
MTSPLRWLAILLVVLLVVTPVWLHFGQKRHNRLDYDVMAQFPESAPIVGGEALAGSLSAVVSHELDGYTGWRPNDFILWGPQVMADNNSNRQLGIILAVRETGRVFKDHLTKVSSDEYDANLKKADTDFRNDMEKLWLPSAESKLEEGVKHLDAYVRGLASEPRKSKPLVRRNVELIRLFQTWTDMLGDSHGALYRSDVGFFETDDVFYHAQGVSHVLHFAVRAIDREYRTEIQNRPVLETLVREVADALGHAAQLKPLIVFDGNPDGFLANHRRNLDAYITEARQKMYSIREELEK